MYHGEYSMNLSGFFSRAMPCLDGLTTFFPHNTTRTIAELITNIMPSQPLNPLGNMMITLDRRLAAGLTCPEDKAAIEKALGTLTRTHSVLGNRVKEWEKNGQRVQELLQTLNAELQKLRDAEGILSHDLDHHRASMSSLSGHITTLSQEDVAAPPLPGSMELEIRQLERGTLIKELTVAGKIFVQMLERQRRLESMGSKLGTQIAETNKAARDISRKQMAEKMTESRLGEDLTQR